MRRVLLILSITGLLFSGCSLLKGRPATAPATAAPGATQSETPTPAATAAETTAAAPAAAADPAPGIQVNVLMATRITQGPDGLQAQSPHQHTIIAGSPELPVFIVRMDGLNPGQHTVKLRFWVDPAPADWLEEVQKDPASKNFLQRYGEQLQKGWWSEVNKQFAVTTDPGDWAAHLFVEDLLLLGWTEGPREVEVYVDGQMMHRLRVRMIKAETALSATQGN